ncbi:MAG: dihydroorotate dehydrogenase electron transfer subunit [Clostridia bacterium]|nr:dihydroorotate dehydrogenase electron transfer subunit [Clostridia bacterium]
MEKTNFVINSNKKIASDVYEMKLSGSVKDFTAPGQFVNIAIEGLYLRRPISVCNIEAKENGQGELTLIYKVVGKGTEKMSAMTEGTVLSLLTALGNGFDTKRCEKSALVVGGGVGVPPMYGVTKKLIEEGKKVTAVLGFNGAGDVFYEEEFKKLGAKTVVTTADGSYGIKGFVTDAIKIMETEGGEAYDFDETFACGPEPMLKALYNATDITGQYSFEERMGCGFGACMGCSCKTKYGNKRICKDGPVLVKEEIIW